MFNYADKYGSDSVFWSGPFPFFLTSNPETVQDILNKFDSLSDHKNPLSDGPNC